MDALGQLAGGVAHDFNNLLGGIVSASEMIGMWTAEDERISKLNDMVIKTALRAGDLVKKLLAFAREKPPAVGTVELNAVVRESLDMLDRTLDKTIRINQKLSDEGFTVLGDVSLIQSAVMNLCINASHAMPEGGDLFVSTGKVDLDEPYCRLSSFDLKPGAYSELIVEDTGTGISKKNLERIFDPFFTTKEQGKGTGLGLAAVYGMVRQYKGEVKVYSEEGRGTSFHLFLPLSEKQKESDLAPSREYVKGSGTILVVDDEEILRFTTRSILEDLGYKVVTAENGREALEKADPSIDLAILDINMPVMDGQSCFLQLKQVHPALPVIFCSGFSKYNSRFEEVVSQAQGFLVKPFKGFELSQLIHRILIESRGDA
jgi:CheY-like chemotaxis protein